MVSCGTPKKIEPSQTEVVSEQVCHEKLKDAFKAGENPNLLSRAQQASGTVISYAWTGANYTVEFLWDVTGGVLVLAALCGPAVAAQIAGGASSQYIHCLPGEVNALSAPRLGDKAYRDSANLRCPDLSDFSSRLKEAIDCIPEDLASQVRQKMHTSLRNLKHSEEIFSCLDPDLQASINKRSL